MGKDLQRRNQLLRKRTRLKLQARKVNAPKRGISHTQEESNRALLAKALQVAQQLAPQA